jgi:aerobic-type carbon monoxide dehydrogenase small subunit (CoxS/CutS family)
MDGEPARSCVIPLQNAAGRSILTIEGLSTDASHPVQKAWIDEHVTQCGYCQSGQIMTAVGLLTKIPDPTDADIDEAMGSVLCRCGTYQRIRSAVHRAAQEV